MARIAQPRETAELKGAHKKDPQRYRGEPIKSELPIGDAPKYLAEDSKGVWFELCGLIPDGILTGADRLSFELLCNLTAEYRRSPEDFAVGKYAHLISMFARFGLTPSDRQKFVTDKGKQGNPFEDLLN